MAGVFQRVTYIATAERTGDPEMIARIERHRSDRLPHWRTVEEPLMPSIAIEQAAADADVILVDCLTIWLSNLLWRHRDNDPEEVGLDAHGQIQSIASTAQRLPIILVSNEVGSGIVPDSSVARAFRDLQGLTNQWAAAAADEVILVTAGLPQYLKRGPK
jgi:adenosylcobinamide kinase/adenosylcobinamide-phosphate guanylyltransferase